MSNLSSAVRQYRHNNLDGFVIGYHKEITERVVANLEAEIQSLKQQLSEHNAMRLKLDERIHNQRKSLHYWSQTFDNHYGAYMSTGLRMIHTKIIQKLKKENKCLKQELAELQQTFDLQWKCDQRAIEMWQEETGKGLTWPDGAALIVWLLEKLTSCQKDRAFFKCCALSGEIPREGSEPSAQTDITKGE